MHRASAYALQVTKLIGSQIEGVLLTSKTRFISILRRRSPCISVPDKHNSQQPDYVYCFSNSNFKQRRYRWPKMLSSIPVACFGLLAAASVQSKDEEKETPRQKLNFIAECAEKAIPAVVHIENRRSWVGAGAGSGFLISSDGLILTNEHVVTSAQNLTVKLNDGRVFPGQVLVVDSNSDLALVKINETNLPVLGLGDSSTMKAGEFVIAIGSPRGFSHTVTTGIISSKARNLSQLGVDSNIDYLQTDAAITHGNSGGPLLNLDGEVVGINSMKVVDSIGFAIPSNYVKDFILRAEKFRTEAAERRKAQPPYVGISMLPLSEAVTQQLSRRWYLRDLQHEAGLLVVRVDMGSPAEKAGLQPYDVIFKVDGVQIKTVADVTNSITKKKSVTVQFGRKGKDMQTTLEPMPR